MIENNSKYCIVGAGLSGLTTASKLLQQGEEDFVILEGRDKVGGRIHTQDGIDLGAVWFQPYHTNLSQLILDLGIEKFEQYSKGKNVLVYNTMAPAHYFESEANEPSAYRVAGGSIALINALTKKLESKIKLSTTVTAVNESKNGLTIETTSGTYYSQKAIISLPPQLASTIEYNPTLPKALKHAMKNTHTWMSNAIKVGITFKHPFWRDKGFSGTVIGQVGPTIELYDHSNYDDNTFCLMGFVNEGLRQESSKNRKEIIMAYLEEHLGAEIRNHLEYYEKDWSIDKHTSDEKLNSFYLAPQYGNPIFKDYYMNEKLLFSGTETSSVGGGYMEGAVYSGIHSFLILME